MKVGFLGPKASFTYTATKKAFPAAELIPYPSIPACIKGVEAQEVDVSVVPVENSIEGSVNTTVDYLFHQGLVPVRAEIVLPIAQQLMVAKQNTACWQKTSKILSHPQALAQSQEFLLRSFPKVELEPTASTAYAAHYVANHPDQRLAAIAPTLSAELYQLEIVAKDIQDVASNRTRFWALSPQNIHLQLLEEQKKLTVAVTMPNNVPGALHRVLSVFSWRKINLSKIESRPLKTNLGEYFFLIDISNEKPAQLIQHALEELSLMGGGIKIMGKYSVYPVNGI